MQLLTDSFIKQLICILVILVHEYPKTFIYSQKEDKTVLKATHFQSAEEVKIKAADLLLKG